MDNVRFHRAKPVQDYKVELLAAIAQTDHFVTLEVCRRYFLHIQHNCQKIIAGEENIN